jgi:hypothetical protein
MSANAALWEALVLIQREGTHNLQVLFDGEMGVVEAYEDSWVDRLMIQVKNA